MTYKQHNNTINNHSPLDRLISWLIHDYLPYIKPAQQYTFVWPVQIAAPAFAGFPPIYTSIVNCFVYGRVLNVFGQALVLWTIKSL